MCSLCTDDASPKTNRGDGLFSLPRPFSFRFFFFWGGGEEGRGRLQAIDVVFKNSTPKKNADI